MDRIGSQVDLLEGDSLVVTSWATGSICPWRLFVKIEEIRSLVRVHSFEIYHFRRSANCKADELAKQGPLLSLSWFVTFLSASWFGVSL